MAQMVKEDKLKALDAALGQIEKQFGKGSVMKLGDSAANMNVETVPTGSLSLDIALGMGGVPKGRIIEIYGPESSGKTTVALHMVAEVQKRGGIAGFIDAEHALDPAYAKNIGVDIDNLYISQPDNGEQALESRDRGRYGRFSCGTSGKADVPGSEKTDRPYQQIELYRDLYQSAP